MWLPDIVWSYSLFTSSRTHSKLSSVSDCNLKRMEGDECGTSGDGKRANACFAGSCRASKTREDMSLL